MDQRLIVFIYLLLRDELPTGKVENLLVQVEKVGGHHAMFSSGYLEAYARTIAERLTK